MVLIIDNYDSFVFNLARYIEELGYATNVVRNDKISIAEIEHLKPSHIIISPGPCGPDEAGLSIDIVRQFAGKIPILGICLGHQVIGHVFGGKVIHAQKPLHGQSSMIHHNGEGVFSGLPNPLKVGRYHSLIVDDQNLDPSITITSRSSEGEVMSLANHQWRLIGLQFHPESILTEHGHALINNFLSESRWINQSALHTLKSSMPNHIYDWLTLANNLTNTIKQSGAHFSLNLLDQSLGIPYANEISAFRESDVCLSLIRKVILLGDNKPMIYARVIVPESSYLNYQQELDNLGTSPIGNALLYGKQEITRSEFEYKRLENTDPIFHELFTLGLVFSTHHYWMRRSIFIFPKGALLMSEVFLDNLPNYPEDLGFGIPS